MADFTKPISTEAYLTLLSTIRQNQTDLAKMLNETTSNTSTPTDAIRWNKTNSRLEIFNGTSWAVAASLFQHSVRYLNGQEASYYQNASNLNAGTLPAARFNDTAHGSRSGGSLHSAVTTSVNGFMSAADKTKLNGIEAGAEVNHTASELLTLIKTVDGGSSGLDADLLDGANSDYFSRSAGCLVYRSANWANMASGIANSITWDQEAYDDLGIHSTSSNTDRLTVPSGVTKVRLHAYGEWEANSNGQRYISLSKSSGTFVGKVIEYKDAAASGKTYLSFTSPVLEVTAGDYFTLLAWQNSSVSLDFIGGSGGSWFFMEIVK